jgi:hypothetical protein
MAEPFDYKIGYEEALGARDAAGWLGTTPAETIEYLSQELRAIAQWLKRKADDDPAYKEVFTAFVRGDYWKEAQ